MRLHDLPFEVILDPADLHENGKTPAWVALGNSGGVASATPGGYFNVGTGARWKWTTSATRLVVELYATQASDNSRIGVRVNMSTGITRDYWGPAPELGINYLEIYLPSGLAKTVELIVPAQHATAVAGAPKGAYPMRAWFNAPATTIAPDTPTNRLLIYGDSITAGGVAISQSQMGYAGLLKRGLSYQAGTVWKGAYAGGTTYAIGDRVRSGTGVWENLAGSTGVSPTEGATWTRIGYHGSVTLKAWGFRRLADDASSGGARTAFAAEMLAHNPTKIVFLIGSNDQAATPPISLANFTTYYEGLMDAVHAASASMPIVCVSPIRRGAETANSNGETMAQFRTAISNAVTARSGWGTPPSYVDGLAILATSDLNSDGVHPTTAGHVTLMKAIGAAV